MSTSEVVGVGVGELAPREAFRALSGHRFYGYRGCAPDPDAPGQAAGDPELSVDGWAPWTGDGPEPQSERLVREEKARAVCGRCPVLAQCRAWGLAVDGEGRLAEPEGIVGGLLALERHRLLIRSRAGAVSGPSARGLELARTQQKQALLAALAGHWDAEEVAAAAGMDLRTANWQRSALCSLLGLEKETATRGELLAAAGREGLLPEGTAVIPDPWPVVAAPTTDGARQRRLLANTAPGEEEPPGPQAGALERPRRVRRTRSGPGAARGPLQAVVSVPAADGGQLALFTDTSMEAAA